MTKRALAVAAALGVLMVYGSSQAWAQFGDLIRRVPDGANAIMLIDLERLHNSPLATEEGWRYKGDEAFQAGLLLVPPGITRYVHAARFDFTTMDTQWETILMSLDSELRIPGVAHRHQGTVDRIGGREVAVLPGDLYVVRFGPRTAAVAEKETRPDVARWIQRVDDGSLRGLSPLLRQGQQFAEQNAHIIAALDMEGVLPAELVRQQLGNLPSLKGTGTDLAALASALATIRGIKLGVTLTDRRNGALRADFGQNISAIAGFAKPLVRDVLATRGMDINDFDDWEVTVSGERLEMRGPLSQSGLRRLLSLFDAPPSLQISSVSSPGDSAESQRRLQLLASQAYFKSVVSLLDDLRGRKDRRQTMGQVGVWFRNFARRIDQLPMANVHPELLDWGRYVADALRQGKLDVQSAAARKWGQPFGAASAQNRARSALSAQELLLELETTTAEIRRRMIKTFNAEF